MKTTKNRRKKTDPKPIFGSVFYFSGFVRMIFFLKRSPVRQENIQSKTYQKCPRRCPCSSLCGKNRCHDTGNHLISVTLAVIHTDSRTYKCLEKQSDGRTYSEDRTELTTGMISTLKNVARRKEDIPPRRDFIAFFPSL